MTKPELLCEIERLRNQVAAGEALVLAVEKFVGRPQARNDVISTPTANRDALRGAAATYREEGA